MDSSAALRPSAPLRPEEKGKQEDREKGRLSAGPRPPGPPCGPGVATPHSIRMYSLAFAKARGPFDLYASLTPPSWGSRPLNSSSSLLTLHPRSSRPRRKACGPPTLPHGPPRSTGPRGPRASAPRLSRRDIRAASATRPPRPHLHPPGPAAVCGVKL